MLLSAGANPDAVRKGDTPLCIAAAAGEYDMVKILVDEGASVNFKDGIGDTPSMTARKFGRFKVLKFLEQCSNDRDKPDPELVRSL